MEMKDEEGQPTGRGYNDWRLGSFEARSDCKIDQYHALKADTLWGIGESYRHEVVEGNFGAYCIADDPKYPYYVVEWVGEPWQAQKDEELVIGPEKFVVHKGDWLCKGVWLEKLVGGRNWHTMTEKRRECVVRLETVVNANINMRARSEQNPFQKSMKNAGIAKADAHGAWRMSDEDHAFLMEESRNREEFNEYDEELALAVRQQEEDAKKWQQATNLQDNSEEDEDSEG